MVDKLNTYIDKAKELLNKIKNSPFFDKTPELPKTPLNEHVYEFMNSLSAAVVQMRPNKIHWVIVIFTMTIFLFIIWASFAKVDEIARGSGKVVPSGQNQIIQNLEGGIISDILIKEGDFVEKDQVLIQISNEKSSSTAASHNLKILSLQAQIMRLEAELSHNIFEHPISEIAEMNIFLENEKQLFETNQKQLKSKIQILKEQLNQKKNDLEDAKQTIEHLKFSVNAIAKEAEMTKPMVERGIRSQVDFLKLQREESDSKQKLSSAMLAVPKLQSEITEIEKRIDETYETYDAEIRAKLNETVASFKELEATSVADRKSVV